MLSELVIEPEALFHILSLANLVIIDARSVEEYRKGHIVGAVSLHPSRLEQEVTLENGSQVTRLVCEPEIATEALRDAGVSKESRVVIYDDGGDYLAARLFWILDYFSHPHVQILDGGLDGWRADVGIITRELSVNEKGNFTPSPDESKRTDFFDLLTSIGQASMNLCNSLDEREFAKGAIPGSVNLPYQKTYRESGYSRLRSTLELRSIFEHVGAKPDKELIFYCGVGYSAAQTYFAAKAAGFSRVSLYDGSMEEWTARGGDLFPFGDPNRDS